MKKNPFKFGTVVEEEFFTNRDEEIRQVNSILNSENHIIIISPRRYGKTSLILKVVKETKRPFIFLDLQLVSDVNDFASQLLKRISRIYPFERLKGLIRNFRIVPNIALNPLNNEIDITISPSSSSTVLLEDVLALTEKLSTKKKKIIVILDEFQEIHRLDKNLDRKLRSVFQHQKMINYVLLGSQESLMKEIFENKKSPFYHFGYLLNLNRISKNDFFTYLLERFSVVTDRSVEISNEILDFSNSHPYYTQQLAFNVWNSISGVNKFVKVNEVIDDVVRAHDNDFERLWNFLNNTERKVIISMILSGSSPMKEEVRKEYNLGATSTIFSSIQKLQQNGFVVKMGKGYELDDPFFKTWILKKRNE